PLHFYPIPYQISPPQIIYTFPPYPIPTTFSHSTFPKHFHKINLHYHFPLSNIYQFLINSNPSYPFLLHSNSLIQNKLILPHLLPHSHFFKNNLRFHNTKT
ncbi:SpoVR family protein, partial [Cytobacillus oceanisediminis]|uniref:SpoVR family protein n=1 Tax=Cytobacillus oceanisediminis TaxID=665099 RepID=UPI001642657A